MSEADALDLVQSALWTIIIASGPPVLAAMVVGVGIAFLQALTQVQEMTLTFIPKMIAIFVVLAVAGPFIGGQVLIFSEQAFSRVETGFGRDQLGSLSSGRGSGPDEVNLRRGFTPAWERGERAPADAEEGQ